MIQKSSRVDELYKLREWINKYPSLITEDDLIKYVAERIKELEGVVK